MLANLCRLLRDAWAVTRSAPLLWIAVLLSVLVPSFSGSIRHPLWDCFLAPVHFVATLIVLPAVPFLVDRARAGVSPALFEVKRVVISALPRLLGFYLIVVMIAIAPTVVLLYIFSGPDPVVPSVLTIIAAKYLIFPSLGAVAGFAIAGISLHRLNGLQAFVDSVLIALNNLHIILVVALLLSLIASALTSGLVAAHSGPEAGLHQLTAPSMTLPVNATAMQRATWGLAYTLLTLPLSTYGSALWVLLYLSATAKVAYPWIARSRPA